VNVQPRLSPADVTVMVPPCRSRMDLETDAARRRSACSDFDGRKHLLNSPSPDPPPAWSISGLNWITCLNSFLIFSCKRYKRPPAVNIMMFMEWAVPVPVAVTVSVTEVLVSDRHYLRKSHARVRDLYLDQQRIDGGRAPLRIRRRTSSG